MKKRINLKIGTTTIKREIDEYPELSHYGEFTENIGPGVYVRSEHEFYEKLPAEMERDVDGRFLCKGEPEYATYSREYNGIKPANNIPFNPKDWSHVSRKDKSEVIKKYGSLKNAAYAYAKEDCERLEAYNNGHWYMLCISVTTYISGEIADTKTGLSDTVVSSLCGIESDSKDYIEEVIRDLLSENKAELLKMGFAESEIDESLKNAVTKEEW